MPKINTISTVSVPKLSDKLVGTSVGGTPSNQTNNFTLQQLKTLFDGGSPPASPNLQSVLNAGNIATQSIYLTGTLEATNAVIANNATSRNLYLSERLFDRNNSQGTSGQYLTSTGTGVQWSTLTIAIPTLQQVLTAGNVSDKNITTTGNIQAANLQSTNLTANSNLRVVGTLSDSSNASGTSNQVLSSTVVGTSWVDLPSYSAVSPLIYNNTLKQFSIQQATGTQNGYLSSADWITFNGKQNAGNYITALTGEATASGPGSASITLNTLAVINKTLTGFTALSGVVTGADSIITAFGKVQGQINGIVAGVVYQGVWNAATNTPVLVSGVGVQGHYYVVDVAGNTNLDGITDWQIGDWAIFNGADWQKVDNTDAVVSVNGQIGIVVLNTDNINEGSNNLYYTNTRARNSISSLATGLSYTASTGVFSFTAGYSIPTIANQTDWTTAYNNSIVSAAVTGTTTRTLTLTQQDGGTITANWTEPDLTGFVPYTGATGNVNLGTNNITAASLIKNGGTSSQFLKADGSIDSSSYIVLGSLSASSPLSYNSSTGAFIISQSGVATNGYLSSIDWNTFNDKQGALTLTTTGSNGAATLIGTTLNIPQYTDQFVGTVTSVGLTMPSAFSVANSPVTSAGTLAVTGAGLASQYVRGDGTLANFPTNGGGGSSVNYYLNGSVNQGTFGGDTYYEMSKTPIFGAGTNFTRTNAQGSGYIASFITDAGDPSLLNVPGGNWNLEIYFQASSGGGSPNFYGEIYKVSAANVFTLIGSGATNPEGITNGTAIDQYFTSIPVSQTPLLVTDRLAIRIYVNPNGRDITLHTEDNNLAEVLTTLSTGLNALNGLTTQVQYFQTGTSGSDFNISSVVDTHTFNLPTASSTNRGALSFTDWTTFNDKQDEITLTTTGTGGPATLVGSTLNIPNYTTDLSGYVTLATNQTLTGLKTIVRSGDVLDFKIGTDTLYGLKVFYSQNELVPSGEATWSFVNTFNNGSGTGLDTTPISFFRGVLVTGERLLSSSVNANLLDYYGNNPTGRYPIYAYNTGVQQFASSIIVGEQTGVVNPSTGAIADLPSGVVANFKGRVIGSNAVNSNEFVTLGQITAGTVTSVSALTLGTSGSDLSSTVANSTTTPVITLNVPTASGSNRGALSSTDWTTFNNKQNAGNYITSLTGEATASGPGAASVTLNNASVTGKLLTGVNITGGTIQDTDSMLTAFGKLQNQVNSLVGGAIYKGTWNAATNNPPLASSVGTAGWYYIVNVAGTTNLNGITDWFVGDWAIFDGTAWQQVDNTDSVVSVNGQTGAVSLTTDNIPEGSTNQYYLNSRARAALSFAAGSGAYNTSTGVITIPTNTSQLTNGAAFITLGSLSGTSPISYNSGTGAISIAQSSTSTNGFLSSTDWNTFNSRVPSTRTITINGTAQDLSANRTWSVGTVTSVSGTGGYGGLTLSGTVSSSGNLTLGGTPTGTWPISISGNAETVDGYSASTSTLGNHIVVRDGNGYIFGNYINMTDDGNPGGGTGISSFITKQGDNYYRSVSTTAAANSIRGAASGSWGINITGTASGNIAKSPIGTVVGTYYNTSAGDIGGLKVRLPLSVGHGAMVSFTLRVYQSYQSYDVQFSGYLYSTVNQWYEPRAIGITCSSSANVRMGRDYDGRAFVWIQGGAYTGAAVFDLVNGYSVGGDWENGWEIVRTNDTPNLALDTTVWPNINAGNIGSQSVSYANTAGSAQFASTVSVNYNNDSNSNYQMLWGSGNSVYGTGGITCNPSEDTINQTPYVPNYGFSMNLKAGLITYGQYSNQYAGYKAENPSYNEHSYLAPNQIGIYTPYGNCYLQTNSVSFNSAGQGGGQGGGYSSYGQGGFSSSDSSYYSGDATHNYNTFYAYSNYYAEGIRWDSYNNGDLFIGGVLYQNQWSDAKYKENVFEIENALDKVKSIRGVEYDWNELALEETGKSGHDVGVIAQEVKAVYPFAVREIDKEREDFVQTALVVDYEKLVPLLLQSIKELSARIDKLENQK